MAQIQRRSRATNAYASFKDRVAVRIPLDAVPNEWSASKKLRQVGLLAHHDHDGLNIGLERSSLDKIGYDRLKPVH
jgi:hypothetical protein